MLKTKTDDVRDTTASIDQSLAQLPGLATLPQTAVKILRLAKDDSATAEDFHEVIAVDPSLCIRVLKVVNSSFYGLSRQIDSIRQAIVLLGPNAVKNIAIASSMHKVFRTDRVGTAFDPQELWRHSLAVAAAARELARQTGNVSEDTAFLAGLLHDVGIIAEMQIDRTKFVQVIELLSSDEEITFRAAEQRVFEATHELYGARLCRQWRLPVHLEWVAGFHHEPESLEENNRRLPAIVHVADILAAQLAEGYTRTVEQTGPSPAVLGAARLQAGDVEHVFGRLPDAIEETRQLFSTS